MVKCGSCGAESPDGSLFCLTCGKEFEQSGATATKAAKKPVKSNKKILIAAAIAIAVILTIVLLPSLLMPAKKPACREEWTCTNWSNCDNGNEARECTDRNLCGTVGLRPPIEQTCSSPNSDMPRPNCAPAGVQCEGNNCCKTCVHGICRDTNTFCGDTFCDPGETCTSCAKDCGSCAVNEELTENIYTEPLSMTSDEELRDKGYVIVRYYHAQNCEICREPVDVESELKKLAAEYKDIMVLQSIDTTMYSFDSKRYAGVNGVVYKPTIRVDGISGGQPGYDLLFGYSLAEKLKSSESVFSIVAPLICGHSDYCDFTNGKIVRTS